VPLQSTVAAAPPPHHAARLKVGAALAATSRGAAEGRGGAPWHTIRRG